LRKQILNKKEVEENFLKQKKSKIWEKKICIKNKNLRKMFWSKKKRTQKTKNKKFKGKKESLKPKKGQKKHF
jgi:hypothetical protein